MVLNEVRRRLKNSVKTLTFSSIFYNGKGLAVTLDKAGYIALACFDDEAGGVGMAVNFADTIAQGRLAIVIDDVELIGGRGLDPVVRLAGWEGRNLCGGLAFGG